MEVIFVFVLDAVVDDFLEHFNNERQIQITAAH